MFDKLFYRFCVLLAGLFIAATIGLLVATKVPADNHTKSNFMTYTEQPYVLEVFVWRKGEQQSVGKVQFPSRYSAVKTAESILDKSATPAELEYFCGWATAEESE